MLLRLNSRILSLFFLLAAMTMASASQARSSAMPTAHCMRSASMHRSHQVFLTRLPRTNKARKYDTFFLDQLPRQATAVLMASERFKSKDI